MADKPTLQSFVAERLGTAEAPEPAGVVAERERQERLKDHGELVNQWRAYINGSAPIDKVDGAQLAHLTEALGGVPFVAEVLGLRPSDVETSIKHSQTTFLSDKALRKFINAAQTALDQQRG